MTTRRLWLALAGLALVAAAGLLAWQPWKMGSDSPRYRLGKVEKGPLSASVAASGSLSALVTVQVGSQVSGQIRQLSADFNTAVQKDQVIARLDPETFETRVAQAAADLQAAEASAQVARETLGARQVETRKAGIALNDAHRNLERKRALVAQGFISAAELDTAQATRDTASEQVRLAQADESVVRAQVRNALALVSQRQAALRQARVELEHTIIRSPVAGTVIQRNVDVGQTVAASLQAPVLFTIAQDLSRMEVNIAVDEADVGRVRLGQKVRFTVDAFPGERFLGKVSQIRMSPQTSANVVTYSVMATVENPDLKLLPGMTANARILTEERQNVLNVANEALRFRPVEPDGTPVKLEIRGREDGPGIPGRIWRLDQDGKPVPISLRLGVSDGKKTEILRGDVQAGMEIILGQETGGNNRPPRRPFGMGM